ncbi:hypothetical protein DDE82_000449 [Stemphylium lycopersici]|nr:hypothetical protein TW65_07609 [Stemphylium lycopersici]RAR12106.1 hypothetical protein DDE82_000449 [Stemphylium lycopersici]
MQANTSFANNQAGPDATFTTMPRPCWREEFPNLSLYSQGLNIQDTPESITLEQLTLSSPEERQAGEYTIMADMSQWVPAGGSLENSQYCNLNDTDETSAELYEQLRKKYLGPDYRQSIAGLDFGFEEDSENAELMTEMGIDESFEPMLYRELEEYLFHQPDSMGTRWDNVLEPILTPNHLLDLPTRPVRKATASVGDRYVNPFSPEICSADLIRCPDNAPSEDVDNLSFFSREYVRSVRLLKVKKRWYHITITDWMREVNILIHAFSNSTNDLTPWDPLSSWFALYYVGMQNIPSNMRFKVKRALTKKMEEMAKLRMEERKAAVLELLEARNMKTPRSTWPEVKKAVDKDCEDRGSLLLGTIPDFTYEIARSMSQKWSWVD